MRSLHLSVALAALLAALPAAAPAKTPPPTAPAIAAEPPSGLVLPAPKVGRVRPLVVVVADAAGAETTDFLIPYGVLKESGAADVIALSTAAETVQLRASVKIRPEQTLAQFDALQPAGADIVVVPAQLNPKSPALIAWIRAQAAKGAVVVSVCEGARVLAAAGLLDGKQATTHYSALDELAKAYPRTTWVRDRRWVQDGAVISTTGVSASIPVSLALVEAIAGRPTAEATAARLGAGDWTVRHRTSEFRLGFTDYAVAAGNLLSVWDHDTVEAPLTDGVDEIALGLQTDVWRRSFHAKVFVAGQAPVRSRRGLTILPDAPHRAGAKVLETPAGGPALVLDQSLAEITDRYGPRTARLAWLGLEYGRADGAKH